MLLSSNFLAVIEGISIGVCAFSVSILRVILKREVLHYLEGETPTDSAKFFITNGGIELVYMAGVFSLLIAIMHSFFRIRHLRRKPTVGITGSMFRTILLSGIILMVIWMLISFHFLKVPLLGYWILPVPYHLATLL